MIQTWMAQKMANEIQMPMAILAQPGHAATSSVLSASAPIHV